MYNEYTRWFLDCVRNKYADFNGRARRKEYWMFFLSVIIISIVLSIIDSIIGLPVLSGIFSLAVLVPSIAVSIRRLHDTGRSGWFLLLNLIPLGGLYVLYLTVLDSTPGENQYGPNPKGM